MTFRCTPPTSAPRDSSYDADLANRTRFGGRLPLVAGAHGESANDPNLVDQCIRELPDSDHRSGSVGGVG